MSADAEFGRVVGFGKNPRDAEFGRVPFILPGIIVWAKVAGAWRTCSVYARVGGVWKAVTVGVKVGGIWKP